MSSLQTITNNHWRPFAYRDDVPADVLADKFDYQDPDTIDGYFKYRGYWYHLDEFMRIPTGFKAPENWNGYLSDSFYSGVLIELSEDCEEYRVATFIS